MPCVASTLCWVIQRLKYLPRRSRWQEFHRGITDKKMDARPRSKYNLASRAHPFYTLKAHMDNAKWTFGLTMMIVGMGGTFLTLWILGLVMDLLKKVFPLVSKAGNPEKQ